MSTRTTNRGSSACAALAFALGITLATPALAAPAPLEIGGNPVAPLPSVNGTGLCAVEASSANPAADFAAPFAASVNAFLDGVPARTTRVIAHPSDFANGAPGAVADFNNVAGCDPGGCRFTVNDTSTAFAMRHRGFVAISPILVGQPLHLGMYADDGASVSLYDASGKEYELLSHAPTLGAPAWRVSRTLNFAKAGLYAIELVYAQLANAAALELSIFPGAFEDVEGAATSTASFAPSGFAPMVAAGFFQTTSGEPTSEADTTVCAQCARKNAGAAGTTGCTEGTRCNEAALCVPCVDDAHCGPTCAPCTGGATCKKGQCVGATTDAGTPGDAGTAAPPDAGTRPGVDAGADATPAAEDSACSCRTAGGAEGTALPWLAGLAIVAAGLLRASTRARRSR